MKPIRLMMRAFGPYKDEQIIDFRDLREHRLFAISGKTGAGKTTIFDGIAFALYGNGSGTDREDTKGLRSQFADEQIHTAVELLFESKGQTYRIFRQLAHKKAGNKSETGEKIALFEVDATGQEVPACKPKLTDIRFKIEEILGLSYDQFNQIVMLPQGEFRKLLTSDTKNKEKILRKVFKTERYDQIAQKLEDKKRVAEDEAKLARKMRDQHIEQIAGALPKRDSLLFTRLEEHSNIFQILEALTVEKQYYEEKKKQDEERYQVAQGIYQKKYEESVAAKQQNEQLQALEQKRQQFAQLQSKQPLFEAMAQEYEQANRAAKLQPMYRAVEITTAELKETTARQQEATEQLATAKQHLQAAEQQYEQQRQLEGTREKLSNEINELQQIKPLYEEVDQLMQQLPKLKNALEAAKQQVQHCQEQGEILKQKHQQQAMEIEQLEQQAESLPDKLQQLQHLKETTQLFAQLDAIAKREVESAAKIQQATEKISEQQAYYEEQQKKWISHRAYELANQLVPGTACPVCGSLEHPNIQRSAGQADKKLLEQAQHVLEQLREQASAAKAQHEVLVQQQQQMAEQLQAQDILLDERADYDERYLAMQKLITDLTDKTAQLKKLKQIQQQLLMQREQNDEQWQKARALVEQAQRQLFEKQTVLDSKQQAIPAHLPTLEAVVTLLAQKAEQLEQGKKAFQQAEAHYQQTQLQVAKLSQTVAHLAEQHEQLTRKLAQAQQEFAQAMEQYEFESVEAFLQACRSEQQTLQLQKQVQEFRQQLQTLQQLIAEQEVQLNGKAMIDMEQLEQEVSMHKQQVDEALLECNTTNGYVSSCQEYAEKLQQAASKIDALEKYSGEIVQLYKVLTGQNEEFISFERFIQIGYLEQITEAANLRLYNLSDGQFTLRCSDRKEGNRRQSGLSLDVHDGYTGLPRDVKSLSGGEKFNASLCLALGLADVIQSFQGNVRIDTMFIDEGFGSLDEESLMRAIDILIELQKSGRIVGVISHVEELKAAMPAIIQIEKLKTGCSRAEIVVK